MTHPKTKKQGDYWRTITTTCQKERQITKTGCISNYLPVPQIQRLNERLWSDLSGEDAAGHPIIEEVQARKEIEQWKSQSLHLIMKIDNVRFREKRRYQALFTERTVCLMSKIIWYFVEPLARCSLLMVNEFLNRWSSWA